MYIDSITMQEFRTFRKTSIDLVHPDASVPGGAEPPRVRNLNLVIGGNGSGKTTPLKGVALASLGPAVADSGLFPYHLIRRESGRSAKGGALIEARYTLNAQDRKGDVASRVSRIESRVRVERRGDLERFTWAHRDEDAWRPIYCKSSDAFFLVGYGASRQIEKVERVDVAARQASSFTRARRIMGLFEETCSLLPLSHWLPRYQSGNPGRFVQVRTLVNRLLGPGRYRFTGEMEDGEYVFQHGSTRVPFPALSDGYRAFLGWIGDLLYHVCETCPSGKKLDQNQSIVMVDKVDLHLHPAWQTELLPRIAGALPKIQFIATSHSPLLVGSLEWRNIIIARQRKDGTSILTRTRVDISKLDADQILLTELFGLRTTRSAAQSDRIRQLLEQTRQVNVGAARELMAELSGAES